jgi:hypothetical protein
LGLGTAKSPAFAAWITAAQGWFSVLMGLYLCRDEDDNDRILTHAGTPDAVDNLGSRAIRAMKDAGLGVPDDWLVEQCPAGRDDDGSNRTQPNGLVWSPGDGLEMPQSGERIRGRDNMQAYQEAYPNPPTI